MLINQMCMCAKEHDSQLYKRIGAIACLRKMIAVAFFLMILFRSAADPIMNLYANNNNNKRMQFMDYCNLRNRD